MKSPSISWDLDPLPTWFLEIHLDVVVSVITDIINMSMAAGMVPDRMKTALVTPLLKKPDLDPHILKKNPRPVSNLSFVCKTLERIVASRLTDHMSG